MSDPEAIEVWHGNIIAEDARFQAYWRILDLNEQVHSAKITNELFRKRYVEVRGRLRIILAKIVNEQPHKINIRKTEHGKPYLVDYPDLVFNLSHSAGVLVIAVGYNCQLGVDIENCKPRGNLSALVEKCFSEEESKYWVKLPEGQKTSGFYHFWTRKEAFVKATGRGIALGLNLCVIDPQNQKTFLRVPVDYGPAIKWHVHDLVLAQEHCSALVADKALMNIRMVELDSLA